jgi:hypothetical protein
MNVNQMNVRRLAQCVGCMLGAAWLAAASAPADQSEQPCVPCATGSIWGDCHDGDYTVRAGQVDVLDGDKNFCNLTVEPGAILDTAGFTVRVCQTLTNLGTITDRQSGGNGGPGGQGGKGHDPLEQEVGTPPCYPQPQCTDGGDGAFGNPPLCAALTFGTRPGSSTRHLPGF